MTWLHVPLAYSVVAACTAVGPLTTMLDLVGVRVTDQIGACYERPAPLGRSIIGARIVGDGLIVLDWWCTSPQIDDVAIVRCTMLGDR